MKDQLIEQLKVLRVKHGETLVLQCDRPLSMDEMNYMTEVARTAGVKALILDGGITVAAVQEE